MSSRGRTGRNVNAEGAIVESREPAGEPLGLDVMDKFGTCCSGLPLSEGLDERLINEAKKSGYNMCLISNNLYQISQFSKQNVFIKRT